MSDEPKKAKPGVGKWFLKKFFSSVPTWIGLSAGAASGAAFLDTGPVGGAIGFGVMVALAAGVGSWGIRSAIRGFYANSHKDEEAVADARRRLRRGEQLREVDFLKGPEAALPNLDLAELTGCLEEETAISRRVEERLIGERPDRADWMDDENDEGTQDSCGFSDAAVERERAGR